MGDDETAADVAEAVAEAVAEPVAEAVAEVVEAQAEAAETAELIAEAALEGARGQRIENLEREIAACHTEITGLMETMETLPLLMADQTAGLMAGLNSRLNEVEAVLSAIAAAELKPSTPPTLAEAEAEPATVEAPAEVEAEPSADAAPAHVPALRRFRSI